MAVNIPVGVSIPLKLSTVRCGLSVQAVLCVFLRGVMRAPFWPVEQRTRRAAELSHTPHIDWAGILLRGSSRPYIAAYYSATFLKGLCHQIRIPWKWYGFKGLGMDMRCLIFKIFLVSLKFLIGIWSSDASDQKAFKFSILINLNWRCSKCSQIALFAPWNNSDFQGLLLTDCLFLHIFYYHSSISVLKVAGFAPYRFEHKLRIIVSLTSVQDLTEAAPATFRTQKEQIWMHFEQPQIRFRTKWKILIAFWASA
jgi:hypothetical protein